MKELFFYLRNLRIFKIKVTLILLLCFPILMHAQGGEVSPNPFLSASLSSGGAVEACPKDPVAFELLNIDPTDLRLAFKWETSTDGENWKNGATLTIPSRTFQMPESEFYVRVLAMAMNDDGVVYQEMFDKKIKQREVCKIKDCHQTTTGNYYGGTDFNYSNENKQVDWKSGKEGYEMPEGIEEYFSEQGILFTCEPGAIQNQAELGVNLHIDDSLGVNPNNNFYVQENVNSSFFNVRFKAENFIGQTYRFTMRFYMIIPETGCSIDPSGKMIARTGHGQQTVDYMDITIFNDEKDSIISDNQLSMEGDVVKFIFGNVLNENYTPGKQMVFRFEMTYYGSFPQETNGLSYFEFYPTFEQFPDCAKLAIDFISAEAASVCMAPRIACVGEDVIVNAAGFPRNTDYQWTKYSDGTYTTIVPWEEDEISYELDQYGHKERAYIKMIDKGAFYYTITGDTTVIKFTLGGNICGSAMGPGIDGEPNVCLTSYPTTKTYKVKDESILNWIIENGDEFTYKWWLVSPDGKSESETKVTLSVAEDKKSADVTIAENALLSSSFDPDAQYTLFVSSHILDSKGAPNEQAESVDSFKIWIYDQPDVSRLNFVTSGGDDTICAATSSDVIVLRNKEDIMGYTWNFTGATMEDSIIHIDGFNKQVLCGEVSDAFPIALEVVNGVCKASMKDTFFTHATDAPTIDCENLSSPSIYYLDSISLDTTIVLPIPYFETSCDTNPQLTIDMHYIGKEAIHSIDSVMVLTKSELEAETIMMTLFAGEGTVKYTVLDGCGKSDNCQITLSVFDTFPARIDCNLVKDYSVAVSSKDGCVAKPGRDLDIEIPSLQDLSIKDTVITITAQYAGRSKVDLESDPMYEVSLYSMEKSLDDDYDIGTTFILWKFEDPSGNLTYCHSRVSVENAEKMFSCDSVVDIRTSVNKNPSHTYYYSSAQPQSTRNPDTQYTLENLLSIPKSNPMYCADVKLKITFTGDCVDDQGNVIAKATDSIISPENLLKHRFPIGVTVITYEFTSDYLVDFDSQTKDTVICSHQVIISSGTPPLPQDCPNEIKVKVDPNNCLAALPFTLDQVPTAKVSYFCEVRYTYDKCSGTPYEYDNLGTSASLSKDYDTIVYPYSVRRVMFLDENYKNTDKTLSTECENIFSTADSVAIKKVQHRDGEFNTVCAEDPIEMMAMKTTNFEKLPTCVTDSFGRGHHMLVWYFENGKGDIDSCETHIFVSDSTPPILDTVCKDPEKTIAATIECEVPYEALDLPELSLEDPCDGLLLPAVTAYVTQKDGSVIIYRDDEMKSAKYPSGTHRISWVFTDAAGWQDSCSMQIHIIDSVKLELSDCDIDKDIIVELNEGECSLDPSKLSNYMKFPTAYDLCDDDSIVARVERRFNGELVVDENGDPIAWDSQDFPLGKTDIRWIFVDKEGIMSDSCDKSVTVKTKLFDCNTLKDTVTVNLLEEFYATAKEVELKGLTIPQIIIDTCHAASLSFSRSDGLDSLANYEIGLTEVNWTFTYTFGDQVTCPQIVNVVDMVPPVISCPSLSNVSYECYGEIPAPYATFEDFLNAGGTFSDMRKYKEDSYEFFETESGTIPCDYTMTRTYKVMDIRNNPITCSQVFSIKDVTAPVIQTQLSKVVLSCDQDDLIQMYMDMEDVTIEATDNCTPSNELVVNKSIVTSRSEDPHACGYNSYVITRAWTVTDICGHTSTPLIQEIEIVDTVAPKFELPNDWLDTIVAINMKHCIQGVPEVDNKAKQYVVDLCSDVSDVTIWQVPAAGTVITSSVNVWIYARDLCGNTDSVMVCVMYQQPKTTTSIAAYNTTICGSDTSSVDLTSQSIRFAKGTFLLDVDGEIVRVNSTFSYDYYKGSVDMSHLLYSNNSDTYGDMFKNLSDAEVSKITSLHSRLQSDWYYFVAMDTATQCMDTAVAYIDIKERPRITMYSGDLGICENDTLDLNSLYLRSLPCVDSMGTRITKEGWMIDTAVYVAGSPVPYSANGKNVYYYAENECGRSTTYDSKVTLCGGVLYTTLDSLNYIGGDEQALNLWREEKLVMVDSLLLDVHQQYLTENLVMTTDPENIKRCWLGDLMTFNLYAPYTPAFYAWYKTGINETVPPADFGRLLDTVLYKATEAGSELIYLDATSSSAFYYPTDSAKYYVVIGDGVCPAVPSNMVQVNLLDEVPTAFTPTRVDGMNDIFLENRTVMIFNRYGDKVMEGNNGWDGTDHHGKMCDPGVYFYQAEINGNIYKGSIELLHINY